MKIVSVLEMMEDNLKMPRSLRSEVFIFPNMILLPAILRGLFTVPDLDMKVPGY